MKNWKTETDKSDENIPNREYSTHSEYINSNEWKTRSHNFKLKANPLTSNDKNIALSFERAQDINYFLLYFNPDRSYGGNGVMAKLPVIYGKQVVKAFEKAGWYVERRAKSRHIIMKKVGMKTTLSIPEHKVLDRGYFEL